MTAREWIAVGAVVAGLLFGLPLIRALARPVGASPEVARKAVHVGMGLACAAFPWIFERSLPVWVIAGIATLPLAVIRLFPALRKGVGGAIHGIKRLSYGEVLFAPAVATVLELADGDVLLYLIPILILTIADASGALVGTRWGKRRYGSGQGLKTVEGSSIFFLAALLSGFLPLMWSGRVDAAHALWVGLILGILAMMAEGISDRGFDNLVIPVGCYFILDRLVDLEMPSLVGRFAVLLALGGVVLAGACWSTLSGGALLGSILLGYGCAVLADWRFALPPLAVFACHLVTTRKHGLTDKFDHRLDAVLSQAIGCLPWVIAAGAGWMGISAGLAGVSFAMGAQLAILDTATRQYVSELQVRPLRSVAKGILIATMPGLVWLLPEGGSLLASILLAAAGMYAATLLFQWIGSRYRGHATGLWIIKGILALAASSPALLLL